MQLSGRGHLNLDIALQYRLGDKVAITIPLLYNNRNKKLALHRCFDKRETPMTAR